ncbi:hypothetical protein [Streptomyces pseudovenezuelae]|uniref:hypothetical protein n=1 Tax=Streptomyces pseudovenezuelae TaxID=67350 RepID=UPI002E804A61|nr:hypothetical protein [Streptomyces pseudovenezuelae]WUA94500.1 hypothetical protein OHO81_44810 [Streptomyces pseudovenezuelae]
MAIGGPTEKERVALYEWLTANGIDPKTVPLSSSFAIVEDSDDTRSIHYIEFVLTDDGRKQTDPDDRNEAWKRPASAPCTVEPPAWLKIPGGRG